MHVNGVDFAAQFLGRLLVPVRFDLRPANLHAAHRPHVRDVIGMRPDGLHGGGIACEEHVERIMKRGDSRLDSLRIVISRVHGACHRQSHRRHDEQTRQDLMTHGYFLDLEKP
jgi:hypothetical protein